MSAGRKGYSLLELTVVLAIVGILAMLAIPSFVHQIVKRQIVEALPLAEIAKAPIASAWSQGQPFPSDNEDAGLPVEDLVVSNLVKSVAVQEGAIQITFGNSANGFLKGKQLSLRPAVVDGVPIVPVAWVCGFASGPEKMTVKGENRTTVDEEYLPRNCRATS